MKKIIFSTILLVAFATVSTAKEIKISNKKMCDCSAAGRVAFTAVLDCTRSYDQAHAAANVVRAACNAPVIKQIIFTEFFTAD